MRLYLTFLFLLPASISFAQFEARLNPLILVGLYSEFEYGITEGIGLGLEIDAATGNNVQGSFLTSNSYVNAGVPPFDFSYEYASPITLGVSTRFYVSKKRGENKGLWISPFHRSTFIKYTSEDFEENNLFRRHSLGIRTGIKWVLGEHFVIDTGLGMGWVYAASFQENEFGALVDRFAGKPLTPLAESALFVLEVLNYFSGDRLLDEGGASNIAKFDPSIRVSLGYRF